MKRLPDTCTAAHIEAAIALNNLGTDGINGRRALRIASEVYEKEPKTCKRSVGGTTPPDMVIFFCARSPFFKTSSLKEWAPGALKLSMHWVN